MVFWNSCSPHISIRSINHRYSNLSFSPEKVERQTKSGLFVTVVPIDAAGINRETFEAAGRDGNYEKELALEIEQRKDEQEIFANAYRMNMVDELVISPSQRISKYIAIPAINPRNENLQVQIIRGDEVTNFSFDVNQEFENRNYQVEAIYVSPSNNVSAGSREWVDY